VLLSQPCLKDLEMKPASIVTKTMTISVTRPVMQHMTHAMVDQ